MKKILVMTLIVSMLSIKAVEHNLVSIRLKSLESFSKTVMSVGTDLQMGAQIYSLPFGLAQFLGEGITIPKTGKPIYAFIDINIDESAIYQNDDFKIVICVPHAKAEKQIIEDSKLELVDPVAGLYKNYDFYAIFKDGYMICGTSSDLCDYVVKNKLYNINPTFKVDDIYFSCNEYSVEQIIDDSIVEILDETKEFPPVFRKILSKFIITYNEFLDSYEGSEIGIGYKPGLGLIYEQKTKFDKNSEIGKAISSQNQSITIAEAAKINPNSTIAAITKSSNLNKYRLEKIASIFSMTQKEYDSIYQLLLNENELVNEFPIVAEEGMNIKSYDFIKNLFKDLFENINSTEETRVDFSFSKDMHPIFLNKITYKPGFDFASFEKESYEAVISLYDFIIDYSECESSVPLITYQEPMTLNFEIKSFLNDISNGEADELYAESEQEGFIIPEKYILETMVDGNVSYSFFAPNKMSIKDINNQIFASKENEFVKAAMADMVENKTELVSSLSVGCIYNKWYDIIVESTKECLTDETSGEEVLAAFGFKRFEKSDGVVYINGTTNEGCLYERYVVGKDTMKLILNFVNGIEYLDTFLYDEEDIYEYEEYEW